MLPGGRGIDGLDRLDVRLVALLGLALLPIGVIAMVQTYRVIDNADEVARQSLIGVTSNAVSQERETLVQLSGAAQVVVDFLPGLLDRPDYCAFQMKRFVQRFENLAFAGYIDSDGIVRCGSKDTGRDVSDQPIFQRYLSEPASFFVGTEGVISGQPVIAVLQPVAIDGIPNGFVALSVPQFPLDLAEEYRQDNGPLATLTLAANGDELVFAGPVGNERIAGLRPANGSFADILPGVAHAVEAEAVDGRSLIYSIVPMIPGEVYGVSIWRASAVSTGGLTAASAILFPLLMWLVSIGVAYFAVHRLVVRHIRRLRQRIRAFTTSRRILPTTDPGDLPSELREVVEAFDQLTERIVRDEADLENSLHEKDVLLKEVHHRVKNNLQLISSMINMQLRKSAADETQDLLHRLQDRVLSLATIHQNLYRANVLSRVETDGLIRDLVDRVIDRNQLGELGVTLRVDVASVALYPDQAVPLSLLVTEALTNAFKYIGRPETGDPFIELSLGATDGHVVLECRNSVGTSLVDGPSRFKSGLGAQLMRAFVMQLDGTLEQEHTDTVFGLRLEFETSDFSQEL